MSFMVSDINLKLNKKPKMTLFSFFDKCSWSYRERFSEKQKVIPFTQLPKLTFLYGWQDQTLFILNPTPPTTKLLM